MTDSRSCAQSLGSAECPRCREKLYRGRGAIPAGPMPEDAASICSDPYGVHLAFELVDGEMTRLRVALEEIAAPPAEDDSDALDILQEHWSVAVAALAGTDGTDGEVQP